MSRWSSGPRAPVVVAAAVIAMGLAAPVGAQVYPVYPAHPAYPPPPPPSFGLMPPHEADAVVRSLGLTPIAPPRVHGPVILVDALGQEGSQVRVTVDRRSGRVRQIVRIAGGAPQIATVPRGPFFEDDEPPQVRGQPDPYYSGPRVITQDEIRSEELPPLGAGPRVPTRDAEAEGSGPRVVTREPEVTGNVPRATTPGPVDPLLGVPKEFRNRAARDDSGRTSAKEKVAARTPDDGVPRIAPLPRPRPADAPTVARQQAVPAPPARNAARTQESPPGKNAGEEAVDYPVQPLE